MTLRANVLKAGVILGLAATPLAPLMAQSADPAAPETSATPPAAAEAPAEDYSDAQLDTFVTAALDVSAVRQDYTQQIETATDEGARAELVEEANQKMLDAISAVEGMDLETYNEIGAAAQADQELNTRIMEMAQAKMSAQQNSGEG
ncbi:DUF4168 domain-containing protein [Pseudooceanicola sp. 502str34]|uniref:DUF4168 domain-containing protein n=1 Tax=Maritimibacter alkaliphilus TaxID=404236 RepID=UPI001C96FABF|nr:DUF4168 domain-containing protein [Maritimibacter alkaliphilus]MBY6091031.1 DUF4168 domain-containing protein [Maritimibacter alkaliphilus]